MNTKNITLGDLAVASLAQLHSIATEIILAAIGFAYVSILSQISIPLGFTPVPLTLQTFAALSLGAAYGAKRSVAVMSIYALLGVAGLPIFAGGAFGVAGAGASFGYILGFIAAAGVTGALSKRGFDKTVPKTALMMLLGNLIIWGVGTAYLMATLGITDLGKGLALGVTPFLLGDLIKGVFASASFPLIWKLLSKKLGA